MELLIFLNNYVPLKVNMI